MNEGDRLIVKLKQTIDGFGGDIQLSEILGILEILRHHYLNQAYIELATLGYEDSIEKSKQEPSPDQIE